MSSDDEDKEALCGVASPREVQWRPQDLLKPLSVGMEHSGLALPPQPAMMLQQMPVAQAARVGSFVPGPPVHTVAPPSPAPAPSSIVRTLAPPLAPPLAPTVPAGLPNFSSQQPAALPVVASGPPAAPAPPAVHAPSHGAVETIVVVKERDDKEQESDLLERMPNCPNLCDEQTNAVPLISLGCYCGPKLSFQKMGRGAETLPFDWMRTHIKGLFDFLRTDFDNFFKFNLRQPAPGCGMVMYRHQWHSFWHDDPSEASMQERYKRRINRLMSTDGSKPMLFVRTCASTNEFARAEELLEELTKHFGNEVRLLFIFNFQKNSQTVLLRHAPRLMFHLLSGDVHMMGHPQRDAPYAPATLAALNWTVGRTVEATTIDSLNDIQALITPNHWGNDGAGGLQCFEESAESVGVDVPGSKSSTRSVVLSENGTFVSPATSY